MVSELRATLRDDYAAWRTWELSTEPVPSLFIETV
jgi:hypothetical protein